LAVKKDCSLQREIHDERSQLLAKTPPSIANQGCRHHIQKGKVLTYNGAK
jgi:hypothetical protein